VRACVHRDECIYVFVNVCVVLVFRKKKATKSTGHVKNYGLWSLLIYARRWMDRGRLVDKKVLPILSHII
jgi:hypothetical protein